MVCGKSQEQIIYFMIDKHYFKQYNNSVI